MGDAFERTTWFCKRQVLTFLKVMKLVPFQSVDSREILLNSFHAAAYVSMGKAGDTASGKMLCQPFFQFDAGNIGLVAGDQVFHRHDIGIDLAGAE